MVSSRDGANWIRHETGTTYPLADIAYGEGLYAVAVQNRADDTILTSADATNWITRTSVNYCCGNFQARGIAYGNGRFVLVGSAAVYGGAPYQTGYSSLSQDGTNWVALEGGRLFWRVGFGNGVFIAVDVSELRVSPEGDRWYGRPGVGVPVSRTLETLASIKATLRGRFGGRNCPIGELVGLSARQNSLARCRF
jgi:hypothetical protein